jgi:hypothetical protein
MMTRRLKPLFIFCCLTPVLSACVFVGHLTFSGPVFPESGGGVLTDTLLIQMADLTLAVTIKNERSDVTITSPYPLPPFIPIFTKMPDYSLLEIEFEYSEVRMTSFNPMRVSVRTDDGERIYPKGYRGPESTKGYPRKLHRCVQESNPIKNTSTDYPLEPYTCFRLIFDVPASPENGFILRMEGVRSLKGEVNIPAIQYRKKSVWFGETVP